MLTAKRKLPNCAIMFTDEYVLEAKNMHRDDK